MTTNDYQLLLFLDHGEAYYSTPLVLGFLSVALQRQLHRLTKTNLNIFGSAPSLGRAEYPAPTKIRCASKVAFYATFKPKFEAGTTHHLATGESCRLGLVAKIFKPSNKKCFQRNLTQVGRLGAIPGL